MKMIVLAAAAALAFASAANAQTSSNPSPLPNNPAPIGLASWSVPSFQPSAAPASYTESALAAPSPVFSTAIAVPNLSEATAPEPQSAGPGGDYYRWQVGLGYEFARFSSNPFDANMNGIHTTLAYYPTNWLGVEGSVVAAFGGTIFANDRTKYLLYTIGPRIIWQGRRLQPFGHVLVGGLHMLPQVADQGKNGFAVQVGGGVEYPITASFGAEFEADYVRSQLYSAGQNNLQVGAGFVVHF